MTEFKATVLAFFLVLVPMATIVLGGYWGFVLCMFTFAFLAVRTAISAIYSSK